MQKIFIVEDDDNIRELVSYALLQAGFEVSGFTESTAFEKALREGLPALVLLDIMLPGKSGIEILRDIRQNAKTAALPVVMMTAKGAEYDKIKGLDLGADDYITKPFSVMELVARVKAVLRRANANSAAAAEFCIDKLLLSDKKRIVTVNGEEITLTFKEFELLRYLMQNIGLVLDRDKILNAVWGYDYDGENRTVDMHIKTLRQKLGSCGAYIKTIRNVGYKIEGPL
ncbi:MAG: response regulator transcription factor [Oscillospiraceae bacterium]|jgi:two-component system alkaline phosphatase synthesis response regulator PhoP|nr:response regulator transcription factor [Oscillospiraceae bacterium]